MSPLPRSHCGCSQTSWLLVLMATSWPIWAKWHSQGLGGLYHMGPAGATKQRVPFPASPYPETPIPWMIASDFCLLRCWPRPWLVTGGCWCLCMMPRALAVHPSHLMASISDSAISHSDSTLWNCITYWVQVHCEVGVRGFSSVDGSCDCSSFSKQFVQDSIC